VKIQVFCRGETVEIQAPSGARLLDYLQQQAVPVNAACGGKGTCHKCRVQLQSGFLGISAADRRAFRESELQQGWRLSCQAVPRASLSILLPNTESLRSRPRLVVDSPALHDTLEELRTSPSASKSDQPSSLVLACDLGSTGVVVAVAKRGQKKPLIEAHLLNKQVPFGSDVMTRLHSAQKQGTAPLHHAFDQTLIACLKALEEASPELAPHWKSLPLICAGNSAMTSFAHQWSIESLAVAPFQPEKREADSSRLSDQTLVQTLPLLAGFVGGDTVAGILAIESRGASAPWMLMDIGTNTEVVIRNERGEYWFSSAPAGPAFEGGNIHHGMRAETGAIAEARWSAQGWTLKTIGQDLPRGICGSGLIDLLAESVEHGLIQADGFVPEGKLQITEQVCLLADDVREFQLAKAATRTAADLLIERAGCVPRQLYLAGTFAQHLRLESVERIGLLPTGMAYETLGNASLEGTLLWANLSDHDRHEFTERLERGRRPIELALQDDFQERFVAQLDFPAPQR
jgi:uncharacterized 2Fe-2S/4Fe-4S cluster protein (DUF4445 family)